PKDLVDSIEIDASVLAEVGDKLSVSDVKLPSTITLKTDPEQVIASVEMPRDQIAEADAALAEQAEQEGATGEGEAADVPAEHGVESQEGTQAGEIRPGGKKEFEDKEQGHNPTKQ
ncbi:MAG TPA: hypothetical protein VD947_03175, partial [Patescibacteria group bacterium]|nr:hypothetical protein [Patescibacteria group bacterium]